MSETFDLFMDTHDWQLSLGFRFAYFFLVPVYSLVLLYLFAVSVKMRLWRSVILFIAHLVLFAIFYGPIANAGWFTTSEFARCPWEDGESGHVVEYCFCEMYQDAEAFEADDYRSSYISIQPVSSFTNLQFVVYAMFMSIYHELPGAFLAKRAKTSRVFKILDKFRRNGNQMSAYKSSYAYGYALNMMVLGLYTGVYHASGKQWAAVFDVYAIFFVFSYIVSIGLKQTVLHKVPFGIIFIVLFLIYMVAEIPLGSLPVQLATLIAVVYEVSRSYLSCFDKSRKTELRYIGLALFFLVASLAVWGPAGGFVFHPVYCPNWWAHGLWHVLSATAIALPFPYFASEYWVKEGEQSI